MRDISDDLSDIITKEHGEIADELVVAFENLIEKYKDLSINTASAMFIRLLLLSELFKVHEEYFSKDKILEKLLNDYESKVLPAFLIELKGGDAAFYNDEFKKHFIDFTNVYLSSYISSSAIVLLINKIIDEELKGGSLTLTDKTTIGNIKNRLSTSIRASDYLAKRVTDTTISRMVNMGLVAEMSALGYQYIKIRSVRSINTCEHCFAMDGTIVDIIEVNNTYQQALKLPFVTQLKFTTPFIKDVYKKAADIPTNKKMINKNVVLPFHPHCLCFYESTNNVI